MMGAMASQVTSLIIVFSTVYSGADQRKDQSSTSLAFAQGIDRLPFNSPHKWPVTQKMSPFYDVIIYCACVDRAELFTSQHSYWKSLSEVPLLKWIDFNLSMDK